MKIMYNNKVSRTFDVTFELKQISEIDSSNVYPTIIHVAYLISNNLTFGDEVLDTLIFKVGESLWKDYYRDIPMSKMYTVSAYKLFNHGTGHTVYKKPEYNDDEKVELKVPEFLKAFTTMINQ